MVRAWRGAAAYAAMAVSLTASGAQGETGSHSSVSVSSTATQGVGGSSSVSVSTVTTGGSSSVSISSVTAGGSGRSSDVRVIDGEVWINGEKVPYDVTRWRTADGLVFRIQRQGGQVHVTTE